MHARAAENCSDQKSVAHILRCESMVRCGALLGLCATAHRYNCVGVQQRSSPRNATRSLTLLGLARHPEVRSWAHPVELQLDHVERCEQPPRQEGEQEDGEPSSTLRSNLRHGVVGSVSYRFINVTQDVSKRLDALLIASA